MEGISKWALVIVLGVAIVGAAVGFVEVNLAELKVGEIGTLLATVVFAALVIERAVEVYINNAFNPRENYLRRGNTIAEQELAIAEEAVNQELARQSKPGAARDSQVLADLRAAARAAREQLRSARLEALDDLTDHRAKKTAWAGAVSTILSLAVAAAGVRILGQFLPVDANGLVTGPLTDDGAAAQFFAFRAADIVLTTFVLAGGADGIHQIIKRFTNPAPNQNSAVQ